MVFAAGETAEDVATRDAVDVFSVEHAAATVDAMPIVITRIMKDIGADNGMELRSRGHYSRNFRSTRTNNDNRTENGQERFTCNHT